MFLRLLFAIVILITLVWLVKQLLFGPKGQWQQQVKLVTALIACVVLLLVITQKVHVLGFLLASLIPILRGGLPLAIRFFPLIRQLMQQFYQRKQFQQPEANTAHSPDYSTVHTHLLKMKLNHSTASLSGEVLKGPFAGRTLESLNTTELTDLFKQAQNENDESIELLITYLEKRYGPDWQNHVQVQNTHSTGQNSYSMTTEEAYDILGIQPNATEKDIVAAHRKLMQKLHPDRGGNTYLAAKINQAKTVLMKKVS